MASGFRFSPAASSKTYPFLVPSERKHRIGPLRCCSHSSSSPPRARGEGAAHPTDRQDLDVDVADGASTSPSTASRRLPRSLAFRVASPGADLRAAASLRALAFSTNLPETASGFAREAYIRGRAREAWDALELRARGLDKDFATCECLCLLGTIEDAEGAEEEDGDEEDPDDEELELARAVRREGDASCTLAPAAGESREERSGGGRTGRGGGARSRSPRDRRPSPRLRRRRLAVASLDVIVGPRLPSESLVAKGGGGGGEDGATTTTTTAYLANVSVAPAARRRGVGLALVSRAIDLVASSPPFGIPPSPAVSRVAVHAEARNAAARALYEHPSLGFELEQREGAEVESRQGRPRRVLYSRPVVLL